MVLTDLPRAVCWQFSLCPVGQTQPPERHTRMDVGMGTGTRSFCRPVTSSRDGRSDKSDACRELECPLTPGPGVVECNNECSAII